MGDQQEARIYLEQIVTQHDLGEHHFLTIGSLTRSSLPCRSCSERRVRLFRREGCGDLVSVMNGWLAYVGQPFFAASQQPEKGTQNETGPAPEGSASCFGACLRIDPDSDVPANAVPPTASLALSAPSR
jgi:hypothetical protein